jgi:isochorismate hydrolase
MVGLVAKIILTTFSISLLGFSNPYCQSFATPPPSHYFSASKFEEMRNKQQNCQNPNLCLLIIDMQPYFLKKVDQKELEREMLNYLLTIEKCKNKEIPIFVIESENRKNTTLNNGVTYGETISEITSPLKSYKKFEKIIKQNDSGINHKLTNLFTKYDVDFLILTGVNASECVKTTGDVANTLGYKIITSPEIIQDKMRLKHLEESITWYKKHGTVFPTTQNILDYIDKK